MAEGDAEVDAASVLPNPSLVAQHQQTLDGPADRETVLGLSVPLGIGGARWVRQDAAEARRRGATSSADAIVVEAGIDAQVAYAATALASERVAIVTAQQRALEDLDAVLTGLARGGEVAKHDQRRQRLAARVHRARLTEEEGREAAARELLAQLTGGQVVEPPRDASLLAPFSVPPGAASSPRMDAMAAHVEAQRLDGDAAGRAWVPDVDLFAGYRNVDAGGATGHGISIGLTVPVTLFDHGQGEVSRAEARRRGAAARLLAERARLTRAERVASALLARLAAAAGELAEAEREAREIAAATRDLYTSGEATLTEVFAAYEAYEATQLARVEARQAIAEHRAELSRARGALLDRSIETACLSAARGPR